MKGGTCMMLRHSGTQCRGVCAIVMVFTGLTAMFIPKADVQFASKWRWVTVTAKDLLKILQTHSMEAILTIHMHNQVYTGLIFGLQRLTKVYSYGLQQKHTNLDLFIDLFTSIHVFYKSNSCQTLRHRFPRVCHVNINITALNNLQIWASLQKNKSGVTAAYCSS